MIRSCLGLVVRFKAYGVQHKVVMIELLLCCGPFHEDPTKTNTHTHTHKCSLITLDS